MTTLFWIIVSTIGVSLLSFVGALTLFLKENLLKKIIYPLVAFSAGALLGGALLHMIPEAAKETNSDPKIFLWVIIGFSSFFLLEQFIHWHHCHRAPSEHKHPVTYLILIADSIHNFIDGLALAASFLVDINIGFVSLLAITAHEIPQELGDFGILIHGGWDKKKALLFNFISALTMVLGGLIAYFLSSAINEIYLLTFAAGNFIYIACSDLIPEIKHNESLKHNLIHFFFFILGIIMLGLLKNN
jgi:zinc and cadmium transporter